MKGNPAPPLKRRWKGQAVTVLALVFFSLLVPLAFLLGVHNSFPSGYFNDDRSSSETNFENFDRKDGDQEPAEVDHEERIESFIKKFEPILTKGDENITSQEDQNAHLESKNINMQTTSQQKDIVSELQDRSSQSEDLPTVQRPVVLPKQLPAPAISNIEGGDKINTIEVSTVEEAKRTCQLEFGSYCLWSVEHKEVMKDSLVKRLKDQLFLARAYYPSIAKIQEQDQLSRELKQSIQDHERMLSEATSDPDLPPLVIKKIQRMDQTIVRAKSCTVDCNNIDKKLRQILDLTEDEAHFHMKQSAFLYHLGVQTIPKSHHCLSMRLTVEYFKSQSVDTDINTHKFNNASLRHYVIISRNILASSVTINSTVTNSEETENMVFHLLTDAENFYAMKVWFSRNSYKEATIHVINFDELYNMNDPYNLESQLSPSEEFRVSVHNTDQPSTTQLRTEYLSVFGHSHFLIPEIFKNLKKVVVLDEDVVVQQDLSSLWNLDLKGKVVGAVEFCGVRFGQLKTYLGTNNYDLNSCAWMSGLNVIDLENWRQHNVTGVYQQLKNKWQDMSESSWRAAALPASLLSFQNLICPLDSSWGLSGLGHDHSVADNTVKDAAVLHYNGNMKPWLELGIPQYKWHWKKFLTRFERFMDECNVNS